MRIARAGIVLFCHVYYLGDFVNSICESYATRMWLILKHLPTSEIGPDARVVERMIDLKHRRNFPT